MAAGKKSIVGGGAALRESAEDQINLASLKRYDVHAVKILFTASQVALYEYQGKSWVKTEVEGSLFVYKRSVQPDSCIFLMNRLSKINVSEPITSRLELQLINQFLLYRGAENGKIFGIWVHNKEQFRQLGALVQSLSSEGAASSSSFSKLSPDKVDDGNEESVNIMQMLEKAHIEFDKRVAPIKNHFPAAADSSSVSLPTHQSSSTTMAMLGARDSSEPVTFSSMNRAGSTTGSVQTYHPGRSTSVPMHLNSSHFPSTSTVPGHLTHVPTCYSYQPTASGNSSSTYSQASELNLPTGLSSSGSTAFPSNPSVAVGGNNASQLSDQLEQMLFGSPPRVASPQRSKTAPATPSKVEEQLQALYQLHNRQQSQLAHRSNSPHSSASLLGPQQVLSSVARPLFGDFSTTQRHPVAAPSGGLLASNEFAASSATATSTTATPLKPATSSSLVLMSPLDFAGSPTKPDASEQPAFEQVSVTSSSEHRSVTHGSRSVPSSTNETQVDALTSQVLTVEQFRQALLHLLKTDDDIVQRLHAAYVQKLKT